MADPARGVVSKPIVGDVLRCWPGSHGADLLAFSPCPDYSRRPEQPKGDSTWHALCFRLLVGRATEVPAEAVFVSAYEVMNSAGVPGSCGRR